MVEVSAVTVIAAASTESFPSLPSFLTQVARGLEATLFAESTSDAAYVERWYSLCLSLIHRIGCGDKSVPIPTLSFLQVRTVVSFSTTLVSADS